METARFVLYRFLQSLFALLCIITLTFFLARLAPGGPFLDEKAVPEHLLEQMNKKYTRGQHGTDGPSWRLRRSTSLDLSWRTCRRSTRWR